MKIVELSDYSMTIMKDSEDPFYVSMSAIQKKKEKKGGSIRVCKYEEDYDPSYLGTPADDSICTAGRMILFFKDSIRDMFSLGEKVVLLVL